MRAVCLTVAVVGLVLAGCEKKSEPAQDLQFQGGIFTFRVEAPKEGGTQAMLDAVKSRLEANGFKQAQVTAKGQDLIRVSVPGIGQERVSSIKDLLTRPTRVAFGQTQDGRKFFAGLQDKLPQDGAITLGFDTYTRGDGSVVETHYLQASDPTRLKSYLAGLTPPAGQKLWVLPGKDQAQAYLIADPPAMQKPVVTESGVVFDETRTEPQVAITFDEESKKAFAELTRKSLYRRLAILVDDKISSMPVVQEAIESGRARISPSPVNPGPAMQQEAQALAAGIKAWSLAGGLTLVEHKVVAPK